MALTAYCRKCGREVEPGEICSRCGTRLGKNAAHAAWCVERTPVKDWMYWNSVARLMLPAWLAVLTAALLVEWIGGGAGAAERMISSGFPVILLALPGGALAVTFVILLLQGKELSDFVVDSRGIHETRYLPAPTALKLALRFRSPGLLSGAGDAGPAAVVEISRRDLAWKDVARVQLWPEKCMALFYAPVWWLRIPAVCTPFVWDDVMDFVREKLGKKKKVSLPLTLRVPAAASPRRRAASVPVRTEQMRMEIPEPGEADEPADIPDGAAAPTEAEGAVFPGNEPKT